MFFPYDNKVFAWIPGSLNDGAGQRDGRRRARHRHREDVAGHAGARRLDDHLAALPGQLQRADGAGAEGDDRPRAQGVSAAGHGGRDLDDLARRPAADGAGRDVLAAVGHRGGVVVDLGRVGRYLRGADGDLVAVDAVEVVGEARRVGDVRLGRLAQLAGLRIDDHQALAEGGEADCRREGGGKAIKGGGEGSREGGGKAIKGGREGGATVGKGGR